MLYSRAFLERLTQQVRASLPQWAIDETAEISLLSISENVTFRIRENNLDRVIRIYRPGYHNKQEILSELMWIDALRRDMIIATPTPYRGIDGQILQEIDACGYPLFTAMFDFINGTAPLETDDYIANYCQLGMMSAQLHQHSRQWLKPTGFMRKRWDFDHILGTQAYWGDWRNALGLDQEGRIILARLYQILEQKIAAYGYDNSHFGLIHCDMRSANLLIADQTLYVIDFDDCGYSWFGYDFAASVSFIEHDPMIATYMAAWLDGYRQIAPFHKADEAMMPSLIMLRRLQLTAWLATHHEIPLAQSLGCSFTQGSVMLAENYLSRS